ncbi:hypothetical protein [Flavobacterium sp.]|jgi:hypothetical protein|uniref:hypothetical protein n=1 Tax=Flavobacterium sp. TaxID=239 RepID=UPI0022CC85E1|nr:hypothetical protein [Flavobacterium sp.]MCZ8143771.1 hypothetical protein [Flavobacterium sp.]MCZ8367418.1 hypothetical protein [Flavobacterium sp.]
MDNINQMLLLKGIGKRMLCLESEFLTLLPNYPILKGNEFIFTIGWANAVRYIDQEVELLIKGLHVLEILYKNKTQYDFGFGSLSPSYKIFKN